MLLAVLFLALLTPAAAQPDRFSLPACSAPNQELADKQFFSLCHDSAHKVPLWTAYELKPQHLLSVAQRPSHFRHDSQLVGPSAYDTDYRNSGYARGHMVPAADLAWSDESIRASFVLSNAVPQNPSLNSGLWRKLESAVRTLAANSDAVYIFTGPIFQSTEITSIGASNVAVPTHIFKVVLAIQQGRKTMLACIVPNQSSQSKLPSLFLTTVRDVEARTGLDFFSALEDREEEQLESTLDADHNHGSN